jgi:hypothetical protein
MRSSAMIARTVRTVSGQVRDPLLDLGGFPNGNRLKPITEESGRSRLSLGEADQHRTGRVCHARIGRLISQHC